MKFITEFRCSELAKGLIAKIQREARMPSRLMEFCGGHTVTIFRYGIRQVLPQSIEMVSGPGCPICVTANADLDKAIALAAVPGIIIATFLAGSWALRGPGVAWQPYSDQLLAQAVKERKPVIIDFYAIWCTPCRRPSTTMRRPCWTPSASGCTPSGRRGYRRAIAWPSSALPVTPLSS